jgi:hypothetical protein
VLVRVVPDLAKRSRTLATLTLCPTPQGLGQLLGLPVLLSDSQVFTHAEATPVNLVTRLCQLELRRGGRHGHQHSKPPLVAVVIGFLTVCFLFFSPLANKFGDMCDVDEGVWCEVISKSRLSLLYLLRLLKKKWTLSHFYS